MPYVNDVYVIDLNPYLMAIQLVVQILEWLGIIPDPIDELISLFEGKPRALDTVYIIHWLGKARNPASRLYGVHLSRCLTQFDVVISDSSGFGRSILDNAHSNYVHNLVRQGISLERARQIANHVQFLPDGQNSPLLDEMKLPAPQGFTTQGPLQVLETYKNALEIGRQKGLVDPQLSKFAEKYTYKHVDFKYLKSVIFDKPAPITMQPNQDGSCDRGYVYDAGDQACHEQYIQSLQNDQCQTGYTFNQQLGVCEYQPIANRPQPGQPPTPPPPPPPIGSDGQGDELSDCCNATANYLYYLAQVIAWQASLQNPIPGTPDPCCQAVVSAINGVAIAVASAGSSGSGATQTVNIDFGPIVEKLAELLAALSAWPAAWNACCTAIAGKLDGIASAITNSPATDTTSIVEQLKKLFSTIDVPIGVFEQLTRDGFMSSSDLQLVGSGEFGAGLMVLFRKWAWTAAEWVASWVGVTWSGSKWTVAPVSSTISADIERVVNDALTAGGAILLPEVRGLIDGVVAQLQPTGTPQIGRPGIDPDLVLAKTLAPVLIVNSVMLVFGYLGWNTSEQLKEYVDLVSGFVGLEEIKEAKIGALFKAGIIAAATMQANALYRQYLPGAGELAQWQVRGLIDEATAKPLFDFNGVNDGIRALIVSNSVRGLNPRQLLRLIETGLFSDQDIADELTWARMRPISQHRLVLAAPYLATQTYRSQLRGALENAHTAGLISDQDLSDGVDSAEHNTDRDSLVLQAAALKKRVADAKILETAYKTEFLAGITDDPTFRSKLSGIGLIDASVNVIAAEAEARANATLRRQALAAERALERATAAEERKAAVKSYLAGQSDVAQLAVALVATGLTIVQAAAWVELAVLQKAGVQRWIYGLQLSPPEAALLKERIAALTDQRKRQLITATVYYTSLKDLHLPDRVVNALVAAANAMISPKLSAILTPVETT